MLRRLFTAALLAGFSCAVFATIAQLYFLQPLLASAEELEAAHSHGNNITRHALTFAANVISYCGFALIMVATMEWWHPRPKLPPIVIGLLWGGASYIAIVLSPTLGLPPNLPDMPLADITIRQIWWLATILTAILSLWLATFAKLPSWRYVIAIAIFLAPHIIGAPTVSEISPIPPQWAASFAIRSTAISFVAWIILGTIGAKVFYKDSQ